MDATFRYSGDGCERAQALLGLVAQTLQDFLASFPYIKWHRSLISFIKVRYSTLRFSAGFFFGVALDRFPNLRFVPLYAATRINQVQ